MAQLETIAKDEKIEASRPAKESTSIAPFV
jgi:hypothetical protein